MSATWPRRSRCCGRSRTASRPRSTTRPSASPTRSSGCARPRAWMRRERSPTCSIISMRRGGSPCSSWRPARFASGSARGSPSRRWPMRSGSRSRRSRRSGMACRPPFAELFDWAEGRAGQPSVARRARVPPVHARPSARGRQGLARRLCGRVEMGRHPRPAGPCGRRDAALQPDRRRHFGQLSRHRRGFRAARRARRRVAGRGDRTRARRPPRRRRGELQRAPATARPQERQPEDARRVSGLRPALRHIVRRR